LREVFERWPDDDVFRGGSGKLAVRVLSAVASAMAGSTKGTLRQPGPARARSAPAEIPRALRAARPRSDVRLRRCACGSQTSARSAAVRQTAVLSGPAVASAMA